jgi:leucyl-tRNA synthetase
VPAEYDPSTIEPAIAEGWAESNTYSIDEADRQAAYYALTMFPYPSGDLHMGHTRVFSIHDTFVRRLRMTGLQVFNPIGWDGFGLPAENAARKRGVNPRDWTYANIEEQRRSIVRLGYSFDWTTRLHTCDPDYYHWTQWIFRELFEGGLAYRKEAPANWCPGCQTVLANEQVIDGRCERSGDIVEQKLLTQWFFRMTTYARELLDDLDWIEWPDQVKTMQRNWIGRSEGAEITFKTDDGEEVAVYTTRPDTIFGATYFVFAPEHPVVRKRMAGNVDYENFIAEVSRRTEIERLRTFERGTPAKRGLRLSFDMVNPLTHEVIPAYAADYVLMSYGAGAIMAVPAGDRRDFAFARQEGLEVRPIIQPEGVDEPISADDMTEAYVGNGRLVNSGPLDGLSVSEAITTVIKLLEDRGLGASSVKYRLRDWLVSRQRSWGAPIPIIHCPDCGEVSVPEDQLPVGLPDDLDFTVDGSPLAAHPTWRFVRCPVCGRDAGRDTDTMDTFVDSAWYFLRYLTPDDETRPWPADLPAAPAVVDHYIGGREHAVMHLLYARFLVKAMRDLHHLEASEPFARLLNQGHVILGGTAMSKSLGNLVEPAEIYEEFGADTLRGTMLFASPPEDEIDWADVSPAGMHRWLGRVWRLTLKAANGASESAKDAASEDDVSALRVATHRAIRDATASYEKHRYNSSVARLMELTNAAYTADHANVTGAPLREAVESLLLMLAPVCPFITEELWHRLGNRESVHDQSWPTFDAALLVTSRVEIVVQVDGKLRAVLDAEAGFDQAAVEQLARQEPDVLRALEGRRVARVVHVADRLINFVTN